MAKQTINIGASPNDGTGTPLRTAFDYCNLNFTELYTAVGPSGNNIVCPGSATITGDLTVRTTGLTVNSSGVGVGITAALGAGNIQIGAGKYLGYSATAYITPEDNVQGARIKANQVLIDATDAKFNIAGSEAMRLNSTGLGVGTSPTTKLDVLGSGDGELRLRAGSDAALIFSETAANKNWKIKPSGGDFQFQYSATAYNSGYSPLMTLTATGNVGIGVTPSAWGSGISGLQVGSWASLSSANAYGVGIGFNNYYNGTNHIYSFNNGASKLELGSGLFKFFTAPSGTAGNAITFTQAMTLDASGNLLVGTTSQNGSWNTKLTISNDSGTTKWAVGPYLGGVTNFLISAGASAGVYLNGTAATSWTSASDERLKDIIEPISNAVSKVASLRAVIGKFKFDENNTRKPFLIAQDIQAVLPEAVDASNPDKLGVAYTDVIPLLVAAIKELAAEVNALKKA